MNLSRFAAGIVVATVLLFSQTAMGFVTLKDWNGNEIYWNDNTISWYLDSAGSNDVSMGELQAALQAAFDEWQNVPCFNRSFSYEGTTSYDPEDGVFIEFVENNWDPTVDGAAAYAMTWKSWGGRITNGIIVFNGDDIGWTTAPSSFSLMSDIQGVATHELGHIVGLDHSRYLEATMFFSGGGSGMRTLEADDEDGLCYIYSSFSQGKPCDSCEDDGNCAAGSCLQYPDGEHYCGKDCWSDSDCPEKFYCYDMSNIQDQCAATNSYCNQAGGNIYLGQFCYGHETCESGLCLAVPGQAYCSKTCTQDSHCTGNMTCSMGYCMMPGNTPLGEFCESHMQCESQICLPMGEEPSICSKECSSQNDCPSGLGCTGGYCIPGGAGGYGTPCSSNSDCASVDCLDIGIDQSICSQACQSMSQCPDMDPCVFGNCVPPGEYPFGTPCTLDTDCESGLCAGSGSSHYCSRPCTGDNQCPGDAVCTPGGYCSRASDLPVTCFRDDDCDADEWCRKDAADAPTGTCVTKCNPFADVGCDEGFWCQWSYVPWTEEILGECQPDNGGGFEGDACGVCQPHLVCASAGETQECLKDCRVDTGLGCSSNEGCVTLGIATDPFRGVCVCNGAGCEYPVEDDVVVQPSDDLVAQPDAPAAEDVTSGSDVQTSQDTWTLDNQTNTPQPNPQFASDNGCSHSNTSGNIWMVGLLLLAMLFLRRVRTVSS